MEVLGRLKVIYDTAKISDKFSKREFVVTTDETTPYPQHVQFQLTQDKCSVLDNLNEGDEVKVHFGLRGREWNGPQGIKYFNTLEAWRLEKIGSIVVTGTNVVKEATKTETPKVETPAVTNTTASTNNAGDNDDLPM